MVELHWTEVDHVPIVWTEAPPPFRASLVFRTGRVDETLATSGQTHLIEHLALSALGESFPSKNGTTSGVMTAFGAMGESQDVGNFLTGLCEALNALPGDRLAHEKQILAAESAATQGRWATDMWLRRYGAAGYGLLGLREFGVSRATLEALQHQAEEWFTCDNAVLWLSGPPPQDLRLRLPRGAKRPIPGLKPLGQTLPRWFLCDAVGGVAVSATVARVSATTLFLGIAQKRLLRQFRQDQALSYAPQMHYEPLNADTAHLLIAADSDPDHRAEVTRLFGEFFQGLTTVDPVELDAAKSRVREQMYGPPQTLTPAVLSLLEVSRAAREWIFGNAFQSMEQLQEEIQRVTLGEIEQVARDFQATALFAVPSQVPLPKVFGRWAQACLAAPVSGRRVSHVDAPVNRLELVYGVDGVSLSGSARDHGTVRYAELAAALQYADGAIILVGLDAGMILIEPTLWREGQTVCRQIRERVPPSLLIDQGSRPAQAIPKPQATPWQRFLAWFRRPYR